MSPDINANLAQEYGSQKQLNTSTLKWITATYRQSMPTLAAGVLLLDGQHIRDSKKPSSHLYVCIYIYSCVITSKHCRSWTPRFLYHASPWQNHNRLQMTKRFPNLYPFTRLCICSPYLVLFLACLRVHIERSSIQNRCMYLPTASP